MSAHPFRRLARNALGCALISPGCWLIRAGIQLMWPADRPAAEPPPRRDVTINAWSRGVEEKEFARLVAANLKFSRGVDDCR